jgi:hypothetical protein
MMPWIKLMTCWITSYGIRTWRILKNNRKRMRKIAKRKRKRRKR